MRRIPTFIRIVVALAVLGLIVTSVPAGRRALMRAAGWALVADDPVQAADAVVIAVDAHDAGIVEAADLVRSGMSRRVAIFSDVPDDVDRELIRRGVSLEDRVSRQTRLLKTLGVQNVELIPLPIEGSEDEGRVFPMWCREQQLRSVIVVASADHTRRLRRIFHRAMKGGETVVMVRRSRFSDFDPDGWWHKRDGVRTEIVELEKLLFDFLRHPIS